MDDHLVIVKLEYHVMAYDSTEAIERVAKVQRLTHGGELLPHVTEIRAEPR